MTFLNLNLRILLSMSMISSFALASSAKLSLFQQQIQTCQIEIENLEKVKTMSAIFKTIDRTLLLSSEKTVAREILYKVKNENRKLTVYNDEIKLSRIQDDETLTPIILDKRPKMKTISGYVKQLILNTAIDRDWSRISQTRETGISLEITSNNGIIKQLKIKNPKLPGKILDCQQSANLEVCLCRAANADE